MLSCVNLQVRVCGCRRQTASPSPIASVGLRLALTDEQATSAKERWLSARPPPRELFSFHTRRVRSVSLNDPRAACSQPAAGGAAHLDGRKTNKQTRHFENRWRRGAEPRLVSALSGGFAKSHFAKPPHFSVVFKRELNRWTCLNNDNNDGGDFH